MPIAQKKPEVAEEMRKPRFLSDKASQVKVQEARFPSRIDGGRPSRPRAVPPPDAQEEASRAKAAAEARAQAAETLARLAVERSAAAVDALRLQAQRLGEQARADVMEIAFAVAQRVLEAELQTSPQTIFALVRSAVRHAGESRRVIVRACPQDAALLRQAPEATEGLTAATIEVVDDETLSRGDVLVDADFGRIDGRLASRLAEVRRAVAENEGEG